jgi:hypothetical protein
MLLFIGWLAAGPAAQEGSDFSGEWRLDTQAATTLLPRRLVVEQTIVNTTARGAPMRPFYDRIAVRREYANGSTTVSYGLGLTGGTMSGGVGNVPVYATNYEASLSGDLLIIRTGDYTGPRRESGVWHEQEETWRMLSPRLLEIG